MVKIYRLPVWVLERVKQIYCVVTQHCGLKTWPTPGLLFVRTGTRLTGRFARTRKESAY